MAGRVERLTSPILILGEGRDEKALLEALVTHMGLSAQVQCVDCGGSQKFREGLKAVMNLPGFANVRALAVVRDAEDDAEAARASVRSCLKNQGLVAPERPLQRERCDDGPDTAFLIVPTNSASGKMEDLILRVLEDDLSWPCQQAYFECLELAGVDLAHDHEKRRVQAGLAALPGPRLARNIGEAAQKGLLPLDHAGLGELRDLIRLTVE